MSEVKRLFDLLSAEDVAELEADEADAKVSPSAWTRPLLELRSDWLDVAPPLIDALLWQPPEPGEYRKGAKPFLPAGRVCMMAARGGTGKTWLAWQLAVAVATGVPWLGRFAVTKPGPVWLIGGEDDEDTMRRRLWKVADAMKPTGDYEAGRYDKALRANLRVLPRYGRPSSLEAEGGFLTELRAALGEHCDDGEPIPWRLLIFDPASRFMTAEAEVDNKQATEWIATLEALTKLPSRPCVLVTHHTNKAGSAEGAGDQAAARGSSALVDGVRWLATLEPVTAGKPPRIVADRVRLHHAKANDVPRLAEPVELRRRLDDRHGGFLVALDATELRDLRDDDEAGDDAAEPAAEPAELVARSATARQGTLPGGVK